MTIIDPEIAKEPAEFKAPPTEFGEYNFPSRDHISLYGEDQLLHVLWRGNIFIVCAGCFRVPRAMKWADFVAGVLTPWASADPDFDVSRVANWKKDDTAFEPKDDDTIEGLGIEHKGVISFELS